jgi:cytochrome b
LSAPTHVVLWDPFVRLYHWSVASVFLLNHFYTEAGDPPHEWLGYAAVGLIAIRVGWGFRDTGAARWSAFWPTRARLVAHLRDLLARRPHHELGHSAIGAVVMIAMLAGIVLLAATGYAMEEIDYFWGDERMERAHEWLSDFVAVLVAVHVFGAIVQSLWIRENLPLSMITGRRRVVHGASDPVPPRRAD